MLRVQLHMHTTYSRGTRIKYDSIIRPKEAVDVLSRRGVDVVAVTDHNTTRAYKKMKASAKGKALIVINGIEISTTDGHLIGLGISEDIDHRLESRKINAFEACDLIKDLGGEVYCPHPFDVQKNGLGAKILEIDGIVEVFNPMNIFGFENELAKRVASKLGKPTAVGADAHSHGFLDTCLTCLDSESDENSILKTLRNGEATFENCRYMTLREMKEWALQRMQFSYSSIREKIACGWDADAWYMNLANNWVFRQLERIVLELGIRNPQSLVWDLVSYFSYSVAALKARSAEKDYLRCLESRCCR